jgi:hypothetical protein
MSKTTNPGRADRPWLSTTERVWTDIGSVERGERNISVDNLGAIAKAMALNIVSFF